MTPRRVSISFSLPPLTTGQAIAIWEALTDAADAIWQVHGDAMADVFTEEARSIQIDEPSWSELDAYDPDDEVPF